MWRPFLTGGVGIARYTFTDDLNQQIDKGILGLPVGVGLMHRMNNWSLVRIEIIDYISLSSRPMTNVHNLALTAGAEFRFGGHRSSYWPWNPDSYSP